MNDTPVLLSVASRFPFTPPWLEGEECKPVFLLRAAPVWERAEYEAELDASGAGDVLWLEFDAEFEKGLRTLLADSPDDVALMLELLAQERGGESLAEVDKAMLDQVREQLDQHWPGWKALKRREARRRALAPILAFRTFCAGWENVTGVDGQPLPFARDARGHVAEAALAALDPLVLTVTGWKAHALQYNRGMEKNSAPPLKSDDAPKTSEAAAAGKSRAKTGPKTPR